MRQVTLVCLLIHYVYIQLYFGYIYMYTVLLFSFRKKLSCTSKRVPHLGTRESTRSRFPSVLPSVPLSFLPFLLLTNPGKVRGEREKPYGLRRPDPLG